MSADRTLRKVLHSAYTFVRSVEVNKASAALTLDHLIQEQIDSIKQSSTRAILDSAGKDIGKRTSKLDDLDTLQQDVEAVVKAVKKAGKDASKLRELGIFEVDSVADDD
jgi:hypothetical protein